MLDTETSMQEQTLQPSSRISSWCKAGLWRRWASTEAVHQVCPVRWSATSDFPDSGGLDTTALSPPPTVHHLLAKDTIPHMGQVAANLESPNNQ
jgi:hypothetical protein